jgi:carboxyl-terminal processing protease
MKRSQLASQQPRGASHDDIEPVTGTDGSCGGCRRRRRRGRWALTGLLVAAAFAGGAVTGRASHANGHNSSPYAPLAQMARVMVFIENHYVDPVERQRVLDGAIKGMVAELDPHSSYLTPKEFKLFNEDTEGMFGGIGVEVDFKDDYAVVIAPIPDTPASRAGVLSGDKIVAVGNRPLRGLTIDKIVRLMRGPPKSKVRISIKREGKDDLIHVELVREHIRVRSVEAKRLVSDIAYIRLRQFQQGTHDELLEAIAAVRKASERPLAAVLLDMRSNPGGLIDEAEAVADEFLDGGGIYSTRHRGKVLDEVGAHLGGAMTELPMVVLVNEYSASSSELVAGALQDNGRAKILGAPTFGKGSVQTIFQLPGGAGLRLTTMRYYTPKGRAIQVAGIRPDLRIEHDSGAAPAPLLREDSLEGHLASEANGANKHAQRVLKGGKRPRYVPITEIPADPTRGDDFAMSTAFRMLRKRTAGKGD